MIFHSCESEYDAICADYSLSISNCKEATQKYLSVIPIDKVTYNNCAAQGFVNHSTNYIELSNEERDNFFNKNFDKKKVDFIIIRCTKDNRDYYLLSSFAKYCNKYQKLDCGESHSFMQPKYGFSYFKNSCNIQGLELQEFSKDNESYSLTIYFKEPVKNIQ